MYSDTFMNGQGISCPIISWGAKIAVNTLINKLWKNLKNRINEGFQHFEQEIGQGMRKPEMKESLD